MRRWRLTRRLRARTYGQATAIADHVVDVDHLQHVERALWLRFYRILIELQAE